MAELKVDIAGNAEMAAREQAREVRRLGDALSKLDVASKQGQKALREFNRARRLHTSTLNSETSAINAQIRKRRTLDRLQRKQTKGTQRHGKAIGGVVKGLGLVAVGYAAVRSAVAVGGAALDFSKSALDMYKFAENTQLAFNRLTGGAEGGARAFQRTKDLANELGLKVTEVGPQIKSLLAQQFSLDKASDLVRIGADLRALGNDAESVKGAFRAITQIAAKGKLEQEELIQLAERGVSLKLVRDELMKTYKVNSKELASLQRKGGVGGEQAIDAIMRAIMKKVGESKPGEAGAQFARETLTGAEHAFAARGENMLLSAVLGTKGPKEMASVIEEASKEFMDQGRIDRLSSTFTKIVGAITGTGPDAVQGFGATLDFLIGGFDRLVDVGVAFKDGFLEPIKEAFPALAGMFAEKPDPAMVETMTQLGRDAGEAVLGLVELASALGQVGSGLMKIKNFTNDIFSLDMMGLVEFLSNPWGMVTERIGDALVSGFANTKERVLGAARDLGLGMLSAAKAALGIHSPSKEFMKVGDMMQLGMAKGITANDNAIRASAGLGIATSSAVANPSMAAPTANMNRSMAGRAGSTKSVTNNTLVADVNNNFEVSGGVDEENLGAEARAGVRLGLGDVINAFAS